MDYKALVKYAAVLGAGFLAAFYEVYNYVLGLFA